MAVVLDVTINASGASFSGGGYQRSVAVRSEAAFQREFMRAIYLGLRDRVIPEARRKFSKRSGHSARTLKVLFEGGQLSVRTSFYQPFGQNQVIFYNVLERELPGIVSRGLQAGLRALGIG